MSHKSTFAVRHVQTENFCWNQTLLPKGFFIVRKSGSSRNGCEKYSSLHQRQNKNNSYQREIQMLKAVCSDIYMVILK